MNRQILKNSLLVAVVLVLLLGLNLLLYVKPEPLEESDWFADRSTHSGRPYGTLAAYLLLQESGLRVGRWEQDYRALERTQDVRAVVFVEPNDKPDARQLQALRRWIANGGTFLMFERSWSLAVGDHILTPGGQLPTAGAESVFGKAPSRHIVPWQPGGIFEGVRALSCSEKAVSAGLRPLRKEDLERSKHSEEAPPLSGHLPLAGVNDVPVVLEIRCGAGRIVFVGDPFVIANGGIGEADNARFILNLAHMAVGNGNGRIVFDDYHHGYRVTNGGLLGFLGYFRGTPIPWLFWQAVAFGLLVAYTLGRRFGRPLHLPVKPRTNPLEFVAAMAQIQKAAASRDLAVENLYRRFHRRLCRYAGLPPTVPLAELCAVVGEHSGRPAGEWQALTERCQAIIDGAPTTDAELLHLAQQLRTLERLLPA